MKIISAILIALSAASLFSAGAQPAAAGEDGFAAEPVKLETAESYQAYRARHSGAKFPDKEINLEAADYAGASGGVSVAENAENKPGRSLLTTEDGYVEWTFAAPETGFYNLELEYFPVPGKSTSIQRTLWLDGRLPFEEARNLLFHRVWADVKAGNGRAIRQDARGNDIAAQQAEAPLWQTAAVRDAIGYIREPLAFYLTSGAHTLRLTAVQEPMLLRRIRFLRLDEPPSYSEVEAQYEKQGYEPAAGEIIKLQAEEPAYKSDPMLLPVFDRSGPAVEPSDTVRLKLNTIGGSRWKSNGQWASWTFTVPKSGLYKIALKAVQKVNSGDSSTRRVYIDGRVPFRELSEVTFPYSQRWDMHVLGGGDDPYLFYFEAGDVHEIKMEAVLGEQAGVLQTVSEITARLNEIYREILVVTGPNPDVNRDYQFAKILPDTIGDLDVQSRKLISCYDRLTEISGMEGAGGQMLRQVYLQTQQMVKKPERIAREFSAFQSNISSLASWITTAQQQPLALDYLVVAPPDAALPKANASVWRGVAYQWGSFISSFFNDYNAISSYSDEKKTITVWVGSGLTGGRDQAQILKNMADSDFTDKTKIDVNLQLISMGTLLPATLVGKGPDVALTLSAGEACNYAFRTAVTDLASFPDFAAVAKRFSPGALVPLTFQKGVYGLPETETFPMLFYRRDILSQLELAVPRTWDDVIAMLPVLQKNQLNFGLPTTAAAGSTLTAFSMLLFQNGGSLYHGDGEASAIDSEKAVEAFDFLTGLYRDYQIPLTIDFANRFRSGQIPVAIADYGMYNQLSVFAPELNGLWDFTQVPGTKRADGTIDRSAPAAVNACIILRKSKKQDEAWAFVKWWTDTDAQVKFGIELESVMGTAARYPTANLEALDRIPWSAASLKEIRAQWGSVVGVPEVPGGYYLPRYLDFAFRKSVYDSSCEPSEAVAEAAVSINLEISGKRREFGLSD